MLCGFAEGTEDFGCKTLSFMRMCADGLVRDTEAPCTNVTFFFVLSFCAWIGYSTSWKQVQLGPHVLWLGCILSLDMGAFPFLDE